MQTRAFQTIFDEIYLYLFAENLIWFSNTFFFFLLQWKCSFIVAIFNERYNAHVSTLIVGIVTCEFQLNLKFKYKILWSRYFLVITTSQYIFISIRNDTQRYLTEIILNNLSTAYYTKPFLIYNCNEYCLFISITYKTNAHRILFSIKIFIFFR